MTAGLMPRPSLPAGTDLLPQIKHIVVLMMENHSYDNYLGMLRGRGEGLPIGAGAYHMASTVQQPNEPSQSWHATHQQWNEGKCDGFEDAGMGYWSQADLPFYYGLARTFPLFDHWFSSCLGPTFPNRRFLIAGTAHGLICDAPYDLLDYAPAGTIFDMLSRHRISWANYHAASSGHSRLRRYARHKRRMARRRLLSAARAVPAVTNGIQKDMQFTADVFPVGIRHYMRHIHTTEQFFADADRGTLPAFSIVDPDFDAYSEENPQDIRKGESFAAEVINRVMHGAGWPRTLLIWVYDEHGGYYDHVPPPPAVPPDDVLGRSLRDDADVNRGPRTYDRYGFRVPAVLVSPYARPRYVCEDVLDHTSVLRLVEQKWNLPPLTARDAAAITPLGALDLARPPAFLEPPELPEPALKWGTW